MGRIIDTLLLSSNHFYLRVHQSRTGRSNLLDSNVNDRLTRLPACLGEFQILLAELWIILWEKRDQSILRNLLSHLGMLQQIEIEFRGEPQVLGEQLLFCH